MNVKIDGNNKISVQRINQFEKEIGADIPKDYFDFLMQYNGGTPSPDTFDYKLKDGRDWTGGVQDFFGFDVNNWKNIEFHFNLFSDRIPKNMLPIANDEGGNLILLTVKEQEKGKVFFWNHDEEAEDGELPTDENLYFVANSFTEFLGEIREDSSTR